jgi:zinc protease
MTIAIVGDVDPEKVIAKATGLFGATDQTAHAPAKVAREDLWHRADGSRGPIEVYKFLSKQQAHMVVGFPGTTIDDPDRFALEVLSTVLSGQGGRLFVELRDKQALAYRVSAFALEGIDPGYFAVYIACSPDKLPAALAGIKVELQKITDQPIDKTELERAKKYLVGSHEISLQRRSALASTLAFHESYGMGWDEYRRYAAGILKVDAKTVQRVAKQYLDWNVAVIATVKPEELTPGALKRANGVKKKPSVKPKPAKATVKKRPAEKRP